MVNLTTASLEPAPLSSGWKSGSLPTGFTPTILREPGRKAATPPAAKLKGKTTGRGRGNAQTARPAEAAATAELLPGLSVPSHARERSGEGAGTGGGGKRRGKVRRAAPSSHRAAGPPAPARVTSFPRRPFWLPPPNPKTRSVAPLSTEEPPAGGSGAGADK